MKAVGQRSLKVTEGHYRGVIMSSGSSLKCSDAVQALTQIRERTRGACEMISPSVSDLGGSFLAEKLLSLELSWESDEDFLLE